MLNIQIEDHLKIFRKLEENIKKVYATLFRRLYPSQIKNRIKERPK